MIVENTISLTQAFARDIEKIKEEFNKRVEKQIVGHLNISREGVFNYLFDGNFINFLVTLLNDSTLTEEELIKMSRGSFFRNLNAAYKELLKEIIITKDRKAEKSDYFDFEFYMYLFSLSNPIDYLIVNNSRDFRDKFPSNLKIITWEEFKKKVTNDKGI